MNEKMPLLFNSIAFCYFIVGIVLILLLYIGFDDVFKLLDHGKTLSNCNKDSYFLSKNRFGDFYLLGFTLNVFVLMMHPSKLLLIFQLHLLRRIIETHLLFQYSKNSSMHFLHYLVGLSFYPMVSFVITTGVPKNIYILDFVAFAILSCLQFRTHQILYNLRNANRKHQPLPRVSLFRFILCPHYVLEILLYFWLQYQLSLSNISILTSFFVFTNILISSIQTKKWYEIKFGSDSRYLLVPFIF